MNNSTPPAACLNRCRLQTVLACLLACVWSLAPTVEGQAQDTAGDKEALIALYNATDGENWANNENWLSDEPLDAWHGVSVSDGRVTELDLFDNQLTGTVPPELGNLSSLTELLLDNNQLTGSIPAALGNLARLGVLGLSGNQLTGAIPAELGNLSSLWDLDLSRNQLTAPIPPELAKLSDLGDMVLFGKPTDRSHSFGIKRPRQPHAAASCRQPTDGLHSFGTGRPRQPHVAGSLRQPTDGTHSRRVG